jgi:hypothetical protein
LSTASILDRIARRRIVEGLAIGTIAALIEVVLVVPTDRTQALIASAVGAPIGFLAMFTVLGLQVINPACSYRLLRWACTGFFVVSSLVGLFTLATYPFMLDADASASIHMAPCAIAAAAASHAIWERYGARKLASSAAPVVR